MKRQESSNGDREWNGFANVRLETADKKAVRALAGNTTADDVWDFILQAVDDGYAISMAPDRENDAVICTLTGKDGDNVNFGFAMSQRHSDPLVAMVALRFAHVEICERGSWAAKQHDWRQVDW